MNVLLPGRGNGGLGAGEGDEKRKRPLRKFVTDNRDNTLTLEVQTNSASDGVVAHVLYITME